MKINRCLECKEELSQVEFGHNVEEVNHIFLVCMNRDCLLFGIYQIGQRATEEVSAPK